MNSQNTISDVREKNTSFVTPNDIINNLSLDKKLLLIFGYRWHTRTLSN